MTAWADLMGLVQACRQDYGQGVRAILTSCDHGVVAVLAVKLITEMSAERGWSDERLREWASQAVMRP
jgi:hypothetical protein